MQGSSHYGSLQGRAQRRQEIVRNFQPGHVIAGRYEVIGQIGSGAMGVVLRVRDRVLDNETVALKFLYRSSKDEVVFNRFRNEVLLTRNLTHQNIIRVHDFGEADGGHFFISMEYIAGYSLGALIKSLKPDTLPFDEVLRIIRAVAAGVSYAHKKGVVHRDIKPDNVLLSHDGEIRVTDFGLARALHSSKNHTAAGQAVGTPYYMSPEQIQGLPLDPRCDIYSLGILAYEMVTGERPYTGSDWPTIAGKHLHEPLPKVVARARGVPVWFQEFLEICSAKKPADRFESLDDAVAFIDQKLGVPTKPKSKSTLVPGAPVPNGTVSPQQPPKQPEKKATRTSTRAQTVDEALRRSQFKTKSMLRAEQMTNRGVSKFQQTILFVLSLMIISALLATAVLVYVRLSRAPVAADQAAAPAAGAKPAAPKPAARSAPKGFPKAAISKLRGELKSQVRVGFRGGRSLSGGIPTNELALLEWSAVIRGLEGEERAIGRDSLRKNLRVQLLNPKTDVVMSELLPTEIRVARLSKEELQFSGTLASLEAQVPSSGRYVLRVGYDDHVLRMETVQIEKVSVSFSQPK